MEDFEYILRAKGVDSGGSKSRLDIGFCYSRLPRTSEKRPKDTLSDSRKARCLMNVLADLGRVSVGKR